MLTKLSEKINNLNDAIKAELTAFSLNLYGKVIPVPTEKDGTLNYSSEDTREPVSISDRAQITGFHFLDSSDSEDRAIGKQDGCTVAFIVFTQVNNLDAWLKNFIYEQKPEYEYMGAEYTPETILNAYNIPRDLYNFEYNLFVIRYRVRVPISNCVELCC